MTRRLLVCGAGAGMEHSLQVLRSIVNDIVVITDRPAAAAPFADRVIVANPRSEDDVLGAVQEHHLGGVDGVFSLGYENPRVIARLSVEFGCPGLPYKTMETAALKDLRIRALHEAGVPSPRYLTATGVAETVEAADRLGYPCVIKPNDKTSSIGVVVLKDAAAALAFAGHAAAKSATGTVVVEEYLTGSEHTIEGIVANGCVHVTGVSDRAYGDKHRFSPFVFESGDNLPSALSPVERELVVASANRAVSALGLDNTAFHGDFLLTTDGQPIVLEITPRLSGSRFGTELVPLCTGVNVLRNAVRLCLGDTIDFGELRETVLPSRAVATRFLGSTGGTVSHVGDLVALRDLPGVYDVEWEQDLAPGIRLPSYSSGKDMIASVVAVGSTIREAIERAETVLSLLPIRLEDDTDSLSGHV